MDNEIDIDMDQIVLRPVTANLNKSLRHPQEPSITYQASIHKNTARAKAEISVENFKEHNSFISLAELV